MRGCRKTKCKKKKELDNDMNEIFKKLKLGTIETTEKIRKYFEGNLGFNETSDLNFSACFIRSFK